MYTLIGECRELGADPVVWRRHLVRELPGIVPGSTAYIFEVHPSMRSLEDLQLSMVNSAWRSEEALEAAKHYMRGRSCEADPMLNAVMTRRRDGEHRVVSIRAGQVMPIDEWERHEVVEALRQNGLRTDCVCTTTTNGEKQHGVTVYAHDDRRDLTRREHTVLTLLHMGLRPLLGNALASFGEPTVADLPPSVRAVLPNMLRGEAIKECASNTGLSEHTARGYSKAIYKHFRVNSRGELIARLGGLGRSEHAHRHLRDR